MRKLKFAITILSLATIISIIVFKDNLKEFRQLIFLNQAIDGNITGMRLLLFLGADINSCDSRNNMSALQIASYRNRTEPIFFLIENGAELNNSACISKPLITATYFGHLETAKILVEKGVDVNTQEGVNSAIIEAARWGHFEIAELIINSRADLNRDGEPALKAAIISGNAEIVKLLIEKGVNVQRKYSDKQSSLLDYAQHTIKKENKEAILELLKNAGAKE